MPELHTLTAQDLADDWPTTFANDGIRRIEDYLLIHHRFRLFLATYLNERDDQ